MLSLPTYAKSIPARRAPRSSPDTSEPAVHPTRYLRSKAIADRLLALLLLVVSWPVIVALVLLVRITSRGPGIFRQVRVGLNGQPFEMYKIRTMHSDAEAATGAVWATQNDPRITALGRVLRAYHLDELPQLVNVIRGEMSLVGPRPERPEFVEVLQTAVPRYRERLLLRPGITGLAQVLLPPDADVGSVRRKVELDRAYLRCANFWTDLGLLFYTLGRLCRLPERPLRHVVGLDRPYFAERS
jgi:lipopolysaccharide/colanic/teichoic acid biosynthesis glycosyltransferase